MLNTYNERHLYVVCAASGWRIERPSGNEVARAIQSYETARTLLEAAGYHAKSGQPAGLNERFDRNDI